MNGVTLDRSRDVKRRSWFWREELILAVLVGDCQRDIE